MNPIKREKRKPNMSFIPSKASPRPGSTPSLASLVALILLPPKVLQNTQIPSYPAPDNSGIGNALHDAAVPDPGEQDDDGAPKHQAQHQARPPEYQPPYPVHHHHDGRQEAQQGHD